MESRIINSGGTELHALIWPGEGRSFLLLHGLASNARTWLGVARNLSERGHRVTALDQRGHGRSSKPGDGFEYDAIVGDAMETIAQTNLASPIVVGQSWGGNVALELAASFPDVISGVAGVDGGLIDLKSRFDVWEDCWEVLQPPPLEGTPRTQIGAYLRANHPDWPSEGIGATLDNFERLDDGTVRPHLSRGNHQQILRSMWDRPPSEALSRISHPFLLISAQDDQQAHPPNVMVRRLVGDHDLHVQQPRRVAEILVAELEGAFA